MKQQYKPTQKDVREFKKRMKERNKQDEYINNLNESIKTREILNSMHLFDGIRSQKKQQELIKNKNEIREAMVKSYSNNYKKWIIVYDLLNNSLYEIKNSLNRNKITLEDIKEVIANCNKIHAIFNSELILNSIL